MYCFCCAEFESQVKQARRFAGLGQLVGQAKSAEARAMLRLFENSEKILAVMSAEEKQDLHKVRDQAWTASPFDGKVGRMLWLFETLETSLAVLSAAKKKVLSGVCNLIKPEQALFIKRDLVSKRATRLDLQARVVGRFQVKVNAILYQNSSTSICRDRFIVVAKTLIEVAWLERRIQREAL